MSIELDVEAASAASFVGFDSFEDKEESQATHFHKIFVPPFYPVQFSKQTALNHQTHESQKSSAAVLNRLNGNKNVITEGENSADYSANRDSEGNTTFSGSISHTETNDNGSSWSVEAYGNTTTDSQGNTSWETGVEGSVKW
jgi:hypothetical protein